MTDVLEPTVGRPSLAGRRSGSRFSRRSKAVAASMSLLAAGVGGTVLNASAPAQAAAGNYNIAVVVPWNRINDVHSFRIEYTGDWYGATVRMRSACFTDVQLTDAMNYWSVPYTTDKVAVSPETLPITVRYWKSSDCTADEFAKVSYVGGELYFGKKYVYTYKGF